MARQASRSSRWLLGLALPAAASLAGCDTDAGRADRRVDDNLQQATDADPSQAHALLDKAAAESAASLPQQVRTQALLASAELKQAETLSESARTNSAEIDRLAREIVTLTGGVAADNQRVATLGKYQPQPVLDALKQQTDAITGTDEKPDWVKTDGNALAAVTPTDKAALALQGQVTQLEQQVKAESDQRNDLLAKSDQLTAESGRTRHQASVDLFVQGADARKQAADLAVKIDQDNSALARARGDLAVQSAEQESLKAAAGGADRRTAEVNQNWAAVQEQVKATMAHSAAQLGDAADVPAATPGSAKGDDAKGPATINAKAAELAALVKKNRGLRDEALSHYNAAIEKFYKGAFDRAKELKTKLSDPTHLGSPDRQERADREAWTIEKAAVDPAQFMYMMAAAQLDRAEFHVRAAAEAKAVSDLSATVTPILSGAKLAIPTGLEDSNGEASVAIQNEQKLARAGFKEATENLTNVSGGDAAVELKHGALAESMLAQYAWSLLEGSAGDPQEATNHLQFATTARDNALQENVALPSALPPALVPAPAAAPAGSTAPPAS